MSEVRHYWSQTASNCQSETQLCWCQGLRQAQSLSRAAGIASAMARDTQLEPGVQVGGFTRGYYELEKKQGE